MKLTGENRSTRGKTCPSATLSTTNPTWIELGSNPGLRGGRPAANLLSHGTAYKHSYYRGFQCGRTYVHRCTYVYNALLHIEVCLYPHISRTHNLQKRLCQDQKINILITQYDI
jgi:hypothetical protein